MNLFNPINIAFSAAVIGTVALFKMIKALFVYVLKPAFLAVYNRRSRINNER